jgi:uncharacterized protein YdbL (DUF1318 family)
VIAKRISAACVALLIVAVCAGCGSSSSSSGKSAQAWVKSVCSAVVPFSNDVQTRAKALTSTNAKSLGEVKQKLEGFVAAASADATRTASRIQAAGSPNVTNGAHDASTLVNAFNQLASALSRADAQAKALPTNNPTAFQAGAQKVAASIQSSLTSISPSFKSLKDNPTLDKAARSTPACASLVSGS